MHTFLCEESKRLTIQRTLAATVLCVCFLGTLLFFKVVMYMGFFSVIKHHGLGTLQKKGCAVYASIGLGVCHGRKCGSKQQAEWQEMEDESAHLQLQA